MPTLIQPQCCSGATADDEHKALRYLLFHPASLATLRALWPAPLCSVQQNKLYKRSWPNLCHGFSKQCQTLSQEEHSPALAEVYTMVLVSLKGPVLGEHVDICSRRLILFHKRVSLLRLHVHGTYLSCQSCIPFQKCGSQLRLSL